LSECAATAARTACSLNSRLASHCSSAAATAAAAAAAAEDQ